MSFSATELQQESHRQEPPIRVMALHALAYCPRLFYLEEVEEIRVADHRVYAGRTLHEEIARDLDEEGYWKNYDLQSEKFGIMGKADCLCRRDGAIIPYEHKRGRSQRDEKKKPTAWPSDAIQVAAYGIMLEEELGVPVPEGRIRYHTDNVTVRVPLDDTLRDAVLDAIEDARELRSSTTRPPIAKNDRLCGSCSLNVVCLPEEERLVTEPDWKPVRLFPEHKNGKTIHITTPGTSVSKSGDSIKIVPKDTPAVEYPTADVDAVVLHGFSQISTQALHFCASKDISVHWLSSLGDYIGTFAVGAGGVQRRIRQYEALRDESKCQELARLLVMAKIEQTLKYILRSTRGGERDPKVSRSIEQMRECLRLAANATNRDSLRGYEGIAAKAYFSLLSQLLGDDVPREMLPDGRNRRPPKDRFNAVLSFLYSLLYQNVLQAIMTVGLEPSFGFFHTPRSAAYPLVLDMMELFRLLLCDIPLIGSVNRMQWDLEEDFQITGNRVWLSWPGKKKAIELFERRLEDTWKHPVVNYSLSYARFLELETRLLEKEWTSEGGLFAKFRIR